MKPVLLITAALAAAVAIFIISALPPKQFTLETSWSDGTVPGILHVHTNRSDGQSDPETVAAAAAKAGLRFLVFTDHGDATREPDAPAYRSGVLCLDGAEISTTGGHYVVFDMPKAPYPLAGEPRDVVQDVRRLGGFGIAAHPDSPKDDLRWSDWSLPIDGLELVNPDTSWRVHMTSPGWAGKRYLFESVLTYPFRSSETIGGLLTGSTGLEGQWDTLTAKRRIVGLAGSDAHAKIQLREDNRSSLPFPSYQTSFRSLSVHVAPKEPLTGDAAADARKIVSAIRAGRLYTAIDAWASPPAFSFTATNETGTAQAGELLTPRGSGALHIRSNAPSGYLTTVWRNHEPVTKDNVERELEIPIDDQVAVYRVEIRSPNRPNGPPWIFSNPIYVRNGDAPEPVKPRMASRAQLSLFDGRSSNGWTTESDRFSVIAVDPVDMVSGRELRIRYGLSGGSAVGQFSGATVETTHGVAEYSRVGFTIRAEHPMRVSIQVRAEVPGAAPERWQRSIVVDASDSDQTVAFDDMTPVGVTHTPRAVPENIRAIMFIVDTTNSKPGASGRLWLKNVRLERF